MEKLDRLYVPEYCIEKELINDNHVQVVTVDDKMFVYCTDTEVLLAKSEKEFLCPEYVFP